MTTSKRPPKPKRTTFKEVETALSENYNKFDFKFKKREFKFTDKQRELIEIINNPDNKIILLEGPAGTSKTFMAAYCGLQFIKDGMTNKLLYVRAIVESASKSMGFLPGTVAEKEKPYAVILAQKAQELVEPQDLIKLNKSGVLEAMPLNHVRGSSWKDMFVIVDEVQQFEKNEILTVLSRIGTGTKMILCGDRMQPDIKNSGFASVYELFSDEESESHGIVTFKFEEEDIVRSEILKYIVKKFRALEV